MTPLAYVALGILGGIFVTAPLGPVNIMIMQRAFRYGFPSGLAAGSGAALADIIFATGAAFGISTVRTFVEGHAKAIQLVGGLLVLLFGARILWRQPSVTTLPQPSSQNDTAFRASLAAFMLTITNPATIFGFIAYFGALGEWGPQQGDYVGTAQLLLGVGIGTLSWWAGLAGVVTRLRVRFSERMLAKVNIIAGTLLLGFGAGTLGRLSATYFNIM